MECKDEFYTMCGFFRVTEVAEIQFNMEEETLCAVAQKTDIEYIHFYPDGGMAAVTTSRRAHDRDLTDLSWHDHEKNIIASWYENESVFVLGSIKHARRAHRGSRSVFFSGQD